MKSRIITLRATTAFFVIACAVLLAASCATAPTTVPEGISAAEIIQKAQEASDKNDLEAALVYYRTATERFASDLPVVCECEYEIGFIYFKQDKFEASKALLETLLARYDQPDAKLLPTQYKVLGDKILAEANAKLAAPKKKSTTP
jgi:outer membrane protein assembly factor BamD (BamD/ComL family)